MRPSQGDILTEIDLVHEAEAVNGRHSRCSLNFFSNFFSFGGNYEIRLSWQDKRNHKSETEFTTAHFL